MTTTATRPPAPQTGPAPGQQAALVPAPPRARRRWGLFAAAILVTCLGVLGSVWLHQMTTSTVRVVAAAHQINRGTVIERGDLMAVEVEKDVALRTVSADKMESLYGQRAALDVAEGSLLTPGSLGEQNLPGQGNAVVSVPVDPTMVPSGLMAGDHVRFVPVGSNTGEPVGATVVGVRTGSSSSDKTVVEVVLPTDAAPALAAMAGKDTAVILDSRDR